MAYSMNQRYAHLNVNVAQKTGEILTNLGENIGLIQVSLKYQIWVNVWIYTTSKYNVFYGLHWGQLTLIPSDLTIVICNQTRGI